MKELAPNFNRNEASVLDNMGNLILLAKKLEKVYENRPNLKDFIGCMNGRGEQLESQYTEDSIKRDEKYIIETRKKIEIENSSFGKEYLDHKEGGFQLSEIMQALVIDLMNRNWFKGCKTIMTSDYDDLCGGFDAVVKRGKGILGMSFDFTLASDEKRIYEKLRNEWNKHISIGSVPTVKYFEDPDTKEKGSLLTPKFIIGASKEDVEIFAMAYLDNDIEKLNNHPFKYVMLQQIEEQLQTALDYYYDEKNINNKKFTFAREKYEKIQIMLRNMKTEIQTQKGIHEETDIHDYSTKNIVLSKIRQFRIMRDLMYKK